MKFPILLAASATALVLGFTSCKKGDVGPAGPQGQPGPAGSPNVIYSDWFTPAVYIKDTVFGNWGFKYNQAAPKITQQLLDSGVVLTYGKLLGYNSTVWQAGQVAALPITVTYVQGGTQIDIWQATATAGNLRIRFTNNNNIYNTISNTHQFRYVLIPGGVKAARRDLSYEAICKLYNIPE